MKRVQVVLAATVVAALMAVAAPVAYGANVVVYAGAHSGAQGSNGAINFEYRPSSKRVYVTQYLNRCGEFRSGAIKVRSDKTFCSRASSRTATAWRYQAS